MADQLTQNPQQPAAQQPQPDVAVALPELTEASGAAFLQRFLIGFVSGIAGAICLGLVLMLTWSVVGSALTASDVVANEFGVVSVAPKTHPLFLMIMILGIFMATLVSSLTVVALSAITSQRYSQRSTALTHTFFGNLILLFLLLPAYVAAQSMYGPAAVGAVGMGHMALGALFSFWVLHMVHPTHYPLLALYSTVGGFAVFGFLFVVLSASTTVVGFLVLPLLHGVLQGANSVAEIIYSWLFKSYGVDALNQATQFGTDYGDQSSAQDTEDDDLDDI